MRWRFPARPLIGLTKRGEEKKGESRSVSRVLSRTVIPLRRPSLAAFSNLPGSSAGHANGSLFGLAPSGVYLATNCCQPCGALLPHLFTLTGACALRRLFSVALSVARASQALPGTLPYGARTFLPPILRNNMGQRLSNRLSAGKGNARRQYPQALLLQGNMRRPHPRRSRAA